MLSTYTLSTPYDKEHHEAFVMVFAATNVAAGLLYRASNLPLQIFENEIGLKPFTANSQNHRQAGMALSSLY